MVEYEWEVRRIPKAPDARSFGVFRLRRSAITEYVALEFPREAVAWVVNTRRDREPKPPTVVESGASKPVRRNPAPP
jgi:hypothetical protein